MPVRNDGIICQECGGIGCQPCSYSGYSYTRSQEASEHTLSDIVPMPYGKILPDLTNCSCPNDPWPEYLSPILCPNCGSDNVIELSKEHNPDAADWFCISCQDSWCYEREH